MYDVAIVGGGPAGLTAAIYAKRANKNVVVFEAVTCGGQILNTTKIDNYPAAPHITGVEFGQKLAEQAEELGAEIKYEKVTHIDGSYGNFKIVTEDHEYQSRTVILACGTKTREMGIGREDELNGKGLSYCATCDGGFYKNKDVAVFGGGNTALHEALYLADIAKKVYVIHRRDQFRASEDLVAKLKKRKNVELVLNANVAKLLGDKKLSGIETDQGQKIDIDGLFVAIGREPAIAGIVDNLQLDESGYASATDNCKAIAATAAIEQLQNPTPRDLRYDEWLRLYKIAGIGLKEGGLSPNSIEEKMGMDYATAVKYIDALDKINVAHSDLRNPVGHSLSIASLDDFPNPDEFDRKEGDDFIAKLK